VDAIHLGAWLEQARARLKAGSEQPGLEASLLAAFQLNQPRAWVLAHPELQLSLAQVNQLNALLDRLVEGTPLPYITGRQEFYGLQFSVNPAVLIPRPETEQLVEQSLAWLRAHPQSRLAADVGTGSGCIAVTLARYHPNLSLIASDICLPALYTARQNAMAHGVKAKILLIQTDLLTSIGARFDLVCANLPYIPSPTLPDLAVTRHEPALALDGGPDGLNAIRRLLADAPRWLAPISLLLLEIENRQGKAAAALAQQAFPTARVTVLPDLAGHDRLVRVERIDQV
jgi:release factor glutamine methyltransferase